MTTPSSFLRLRAGLSRMPLGLAAGCGVVNAILLIGQYWLLASVVHDVLMAGAGLDDVWPRLWPILALVALRAAAVWGAEAASAAAAARVKNDVRAALIDRIMALGPVRLADRQTGELSALLVDGVEALEPYYARFLPAMMVAALAPAAILVVVAPTDWLSGVILAVTAPLIPLFMVLIGRGAERLNQRQWTRLARMSAHFLEVLQNLTTLKLFNASRREAEVIAKVSEDYRLATMSVLRVAFASALALEFFATVSIAMVAVFIGFRLLAGEMTFQRGFFVLLLAPEFYLPLRSLGAHYHARMEAIGAAGRMVDLLARPVPADGGAKPATAGPVAIAFERVGLTYGDGRVGLDGADFRLEPGVVTALVGPSGAGKSSVVSLLLGFVRPSAGRIVAGGVDLADLDPGAWRRMLAWVPQRPYLFRGTIAENLRLGATDASDGDLARAARLTGAADFIEALPDGYGHVVGERGVGLSGGQARLLALTRAALRDAPLLILDEPTASLDRASEARIGEAVRVLARGRTVLVVAHRLETVRDAATILVLDRGRVAERGDHGSLMARDGLYAALVRDGELGPGRAP